MRDARQLFLRLERKGDTIVGHASEDGHTWQQCGATVMGMSDPVYVGLHALAPGGVPATTTRFSYFRVLRKRADVRREAQILARQERAANTSTTAYSVRNLR
jgi:regulation of enolase protein 1 (concanavalin A-like superfamily)